MKAVFSKFINNWTFSKTFLKFFAYFQETPILMNTSYSLLLSLLNKGMHRASILYKQTLLPLAKTPSYIALFISPVDYDTTVTYSKRKRQCFNVFTFHGSSHQHLFVKECLHHLRSKNTRVFSMTDFWP